MKRSESVLVYAVTAVLAVILVVAVVFGSEGDARAGDRVGSAAPGAPDGATPLFEKLRNVPPPAEEPGGQAEGPGGTEGPDPGSPGPQDTGGEPLTGPGQNGVPVGPLRREAAAARIVTALGEFELERQLDGTLYRTHTVRRGETFSELVLAWTGDSDNEAVVRALNEDVQPDLLKAGQVLRFPFVDDAELLAAYDARMAARSAPRTPPVTPPVAAPGATPPGGRPSSAGDAVAGDLYEIQKGDSLWSIAERRVGAGAADEYVRAIVAANQAIRDAGRIRAGDKIVLPARP